MGLRYWNAPFSNSKTFKADKSSPQHHCIVLKQLPLDLFGIVRQENNAPIPKVPFCLVLNIETHVNLHFMGTKAFYGHRTQNQYSPEHGNQGGTFLQKNGTKNDSIYGLDTTKDTYGGNGEIAETAQKHGMPYGRGQECQNKNPG